MAEAQESPLGKKLRDLSRSRGVRRNKLAAFLGEELCALWDIDSSHDRPDVVRAKVTRHLESMIGNLEDEEAKQVARVSYNILDLPELHDRLLLARQKWFAKNRQGPGTDTCRRRMRSPIIPEFEKALRTLAAKKFLPLPPEPTPRKSHPWLVPIAVGTAATVLGVTVAVAFNRASQEVAPNEVSSSASNKPRIAPTDPLIVHQTWPSGRSCDGATEVAMLPGNADISAFNGQEDPRPAIASAKGGGSWQQGHLLLNLIGADGIPVQVLDLRPVINPTQLAPPAWIYSPYGGGCGDVYNRTFKLDLDKRSIRDAGIDEYYGQLGPGEKGPPIEPLGPAFMVTDRDPALIRIDALSCRGNYEWSLVIKYSHGNQTGEKRIGPFRSMGVAKDTSAYVQERPDGKSRIVKQKGTLSGPSPKSAPDSGLPC